MSAVAARFLHPGDVLVENDWTLDVTSASQGPWEDHEGLWEIVVTRQLGPAYPQHFALDQIVEVK